MSNSDGSQRDLLFGDQVIRIFRKDFGIFDDAILKADVVVGHSINNGINVVVGLGALLRIPFDWLGGTVVVVTEFRTAFARFIVDGLSDVHRGLGLFDGIVVAVLDLLNVVGGFTLAFNGSLISFVEDARWVCIGFFGDVFKLDLKDGI